MALAGFVVSGAAAQTVKTGPTGAILYKGGLAWVEEEGRGKTDGEWAELPLHSVPVNGTLTVRAGDDLVVAELVGQPAVAAQLPDMLGGGKGDTVTVYYDGGSAVGRFAGSTVAGSDLGPLVPLAGQSGVTYVPVSRIVKIEGPLPPEKPSLVRPGNVRVRVTGGDEEAPHVFSATYLTAGLGWAPSYVLELSDDESGKLRMDAVVVNDAMDLGSVQVRFATGEASFPFSEVRSPLLDASVTADEISAAAVSGTARARYPQYGQAQMYNDIRAQQYQSVRPDVPAEATAGPSEETHLYGPRELSLKKGQRAVLPIGSAKVKARPVYYWEAPANTSGREQSGVRLAALLTNGMGFPLTTGPVLVTQQGRPLGQGVIKYTHVGAEALVQMSQASSVLATSEEEETDRSNAAVRVGAGRYYKVSVAGRMTIRNQKDRKVTVILEREIWGKVVSTTNDGKVEERLLSPYEANPQSRVRWTVDVERGAEAKIRYSYETLVSD
jgi:hypothetical protein